MVKFLIHRPIAVLMTYLALVIMGIIGARQLPVSLLPDINIPEITVHISYPEYTARELENHVTRGLRRQLQQCHGIESIDSETRNGYAILRLRFKYGMHTDFAAIDVNEKIDRSMNWLPREMERPRVIKASATDIPVLYLNISLKNTDQGYNFMEISTFAHNVIRKRIEQLEEVALVDVTGLDKPEIIVEPEDYKLKSLGIDHEQLSNIFRVNNIQLGNISVKDGFYRYNIQFDSRMSSAEDLSDLYINTGTRILQLQDLAKITVQPQKKEGFFTVNDQKGISMAIIKQADTRIQDLRDQLEKIKSHFNAEYPELQFNYAQDQSALLEYSIGNLKSTLLIGGILAFLVVLLFMSNIRLPFLIGLSIPVSVIISLLFFMLFGISINIISLSGLILGIGLMIDNSIIVIDNISQFRERGHNLENACIKGTNEVIRPLLSSALTTSAVFMPLVFISGLAGALFYDQAITVSIGLGVSYIVSITFLPVLFFLFFNKHHNQPKTITNRRFPAELIYNKGFNLVFRFKYLSLLVSLGLIASVYVLFLQIKKEKFPAYPQKDIVLRIDWNENINTATSHQRLMHLLNPLRDRIVQTNSWLGRQDYLLNPDLNVSPSEAKVYLESQSNETLPDLKKKISAYMDQQFPSATYHFESPENIFEKTFSNKEAAFVVKLHVNDDEKDPETIRKWFSLINNQSGFKSNNDLALDQYLAFIPDFEKIMIYNIPIDEIYASLRTVFAENEIGTIKTYDDVVTVSLTAGNKDFMNSLKEARVPNHNGAYLPLMAVLEMKEIMDFKKITADLNQEYIPYEFEVDSRQAYQVERNVRDLFPPDSDVEFSFDGSIYQFRQYLDELLIVLGISLLLLYFILAAQFESLLQPLIILLEIPIDIAGALFILLLFGGSLNVMSAIGIIVMTGIIINDSILKIDTINRLRRQEGMNIIEAIHEGGKRRLRPIIMTSLTTILAVLPVLFGSDLGSELQTPLALAIAGGLGLGTVVSLYFIPLAYWFIYK